MKRLVGVEGGPALVLGKVYEPVEDKLDHAQHDAARDDPDKGCLHQGMNGEAVQPHSLGPKVSSSDGA